MGMKRSVDTSWRISSIGNSTERKSGVTGSSVSGRSTGMGGKGLSALMLYQNRGKSDSFSRNLVWSDIGCSFQRCSSSLEMRLLRRRSASGELTATGEPSGRAAAPSQPWLRHKDRAPIIGLAALRLLQ